MTYEEFVERILNDAQFRADLEKDPDATLDQAGVSAKMSPEEKASLVSGLKKFDWNNARVVANSFKGKFLT